MLARLAAMPVERVPLRAAAGRVLAERLVADRPSPAADVSSMDGYAVATASLRSGALPVTGEALIGCEPAPLRTPGASRIVTGAPIPAGADAVIKREDVVEGTGSITVPESVVLALRPGACIRRAGENIAAGGEVAGPGCEIGPAVCGALAAFGCMQPAVYRRVRVGVLVTGDELVGSEAAPTPWQVRDSNGASLIALLSSRPWLEVAGARRSEDTPEALREHAAALLRDADALVATGGVSMGVRDYVPGVIAGLGAEILFHKVRQRPGKPVLGAMTVDGRPVLALPGNPVSVLVTARRMLGPVLRRMAGLRPAADTMVAVANPDRERLELWWHRPVALEAGGMVRLITGRGSGDLVAAARSDGFIEVPPGQAGSGPWAFYGWGL